MTDSSPPSEKAPDDTDDPRSFAAREIPSAWVQFRPVLLSIAGSAALHLAVFGFIYWISTFRIDLGAELEWLQTTDELTGVGHRVSDRFADLGDVTEPTPPEPEADEDRGPELKSSDALEEALKGTYEPPEPPDDREATESPEPRPRDEPPQENRDEEAEERATDGESDRVADAENEGGSRRTFEQLADHHSLDRRGPNDLPDMRSFAPGNARMSALVRVDRMRGQPYEEGIRQILRALPDYRLLLGVPDFDPVRDMEWFFMTSPNPQYVQHTFLAVRHRLSAERVRELLDRRYPDPPAWETYREFPVRALVPDHPDYRDPRKILLAEEGLAMVAKERLLPELVDPLSEDSELLARSSGRGTGDENRNHGGERGADRGSGARTSDGERPSLLDGLARIHRVARREETVILLSARGLRFAMPGVGPLPRFESVRLEVSRPEKPTLNIDLQFANSSRAESFAARCPAIREAVDGAIPFSGALGLSEKLDRLDCRAEGQYVNVHASYTAAEIADLADLAHPFVPRPPVLDELPEPPDPEVGKGDSGGTSTDAGSAPSGAETTDAGTSSAESNDSSSPATPRSPASGDGPSNPSDSPDGSSLPE